MDFAELIELLRNPGEDGIEPSIYDDLTSMYGDSVSAREGADALLAERDATIASMTADHESAVAELNAEIQRLKAKGYDLLVNGQGEQGADPAPEVLEDVSDDIVEDDSDSDDPFAFMFETVPNTNPDKKDVE